MPDVKTVISLDESLLAQVDELAREMQVSRSRFFAQAVEEFIERHENRQLLAALNAAQDDAPAAEEELLQREMRRRQRQLVEDEW